MTNKTTRIGKVIRSRNAGPHHAVLTVRGRNSPGAPYRHRREPCAECPWRKDAPVGAFPAEAFRLSAETAYDMSEHAFACHMSGTDRSATCAGFLLRGAAHNLGVRLRMAAGDLDPETVVSEVELYDGYREMAVANGVASDDPVLAPCRKGGIGE